MFLINKSFSSQYEILSLMVFKANKFTLLNSYHPLKKIFFSFFILSEPVFRCSQCSCQYVYNISQYRLKYHKYFTSPLYYWNFIKILCHKNTDQIPYSNIILRTNHDLNWKLLIKSFRFWNLFFEHFQNLN